MAKIPSRLEDLLPVAAFEKVVDVLQRPELSTKVRDALAMVGLKEANPLAQVQQAWQQARSWLGTIAGDVNLRENQLINATGQLFQPDFDRVPMSTAACLSQAKAASGNQDRSQCDSRASEAIQRCLGVRYHRWLSEPFSGLQIVARSLGPRGILMARSDSVRIPGLGDVHGMLAAWNQNVTEIGAANGATAEDWRAAVSDAAGKLVVLVSPTGLPADMAAQQRTQAIAAARHANVPVAELLADGSVSRSLSQQYGFPLVAERLGSGSDLVLLPMNCLMGGTRGLLCVGKESCVDTVAGAAASLSAEMDSAAMAANILTLQLANLDEELDRGVAGALSLNPEGLRSRCQRMAIQLSGVGAVAAATVVDSQHPLGPTPWDRYRLSNPHIQLEILGDQDRFLQRLRTGGEEYPAVEVRQCEGQLQVDLRFVHPDHDHQIVQAITATDL